MHGIEAAYSCREDGCLGTAGHHSVGLAKTDKVECVDDGVVRRSAGGNHTIVGAMITIVHRDVSRSDVGNHLRDEEGVVFGAVGGVDGIISGLLFESVKTADACGDDYTDAVAVEVLFFLKTGISYGLTRSHHGILGIKVELTQLFAVEMLVAVETLDLAGELGFEQRCVEMGDRAGTAHAVDGVFPGGLHIVAERSDGAEACDYYSFKFHINQKIAAVQIALRLGKGRAAQSVEAHPYFPKIAPEAMHRGLFGVIGFDVRNPIISKLLRCKR